MPRLPTVSGGKTWWEDVNFSGMHGKKGRNAREYLRASEPLPERLLLPLGGNFLPDWQYVAQRKEAPQSIASWVPIQDPKYVDPLWYVPETHRPASQGAVLSPFVAPVDPNSSLGPNLGFLWLTDLPGGWDNDDYRYSGRLWLVTVRPIPAGHFLRANLQDAWEFYGWSQATRILAERIEEAVLSGSSWASLMGGRVKGFFPRPWYMDFTQFEYTAQGAPKCHYSYNLHWVAGSDPSSGGSSPAHESSSYPVGLEGPAVSSSVVTHGRSPGLVGAGLLPRAEVFSNRGNLHPKAYDHTANFAEDGQPLRFAELYTWWTAEVTRVTALRVSLQLPEFSGHELVAIRARTKRYGRHGSAAAVKRLKGAVKSAPRKRGKTGLEQVTEEPGSGIESVVLLATSSAVGLSGLRGPEEVRGTRSGLCQGPRKSWGSDGVPVSEPPNLPCNSRSVTPRSKGTKRGLRSAPSDPTSGPLSDGSAHEVALDSDLEGPFENPRLGEDAAGGSDEPVRRVTYIEMLTSGLSVTGTPSREDAVEFFRRVGSCLGSLAEELINTQRALAEFMQRLENEE